MLIGYYPGAMQKKFVKEISAHRLRNEMIAMILANDMVNFGGANLAHRMADETGTRIAEVSTCFTLARHVFEVDSYWEQLEALDNKIPAALQLEMMHESQRLLRRVTRWFLRHRRKDVPLAQEIERFRPAVAELRKNLPALLDANEAADLAEDTRKLIERGLPKALAEQSAFQSTLFSALDITEAAEELNAPVRLVAEMYFKLGVKLDLHWFLTQIVRQPVDNHWQAFARAAFREELDWQQRQMTVAVMRLTDSAATAEQKLALWCDNNAEKKRWLQLLTDFRASTVHEFAKFSVALRELGILLQSCQRQIAMGTRLKAPAKSGAKVTPIAVKTQVEAKLKEKAVKKPAKVSARKGDSRR
jgi:glutamate dehydrogenase